MFFCIFFHYGRSVIFAVKTDQDKLNIIFQIVRQYFFQFFHVCHGHWA